MVENLPTVQETWVKSPEVGNGNPLQYSYLETSMDRGSWQAIVDEVTESQSRLSD